MTLNSLPVTLSPTLDRLFTASVVRIAAVVTSSVLIVVAFTIWLLSILAELQILLEQTESLIEILSVDLPQPRSIWKLLFGDIFCLSRISTIFRKMQFIIWNPFSYVTAVVTYIRTIRNEFFLRFETVFSVICPTNVTL